ncbi:unnamed protein product [Prunus armeniaca]
MVAYQTTSYARRFWQTGQDCGSMLSRWVIMSRLIPCISLWDQAKMSVFFVRNLTSCCRTVGVSWEPI